jgi:hypothetical protein
MITKKINITNIPINTLTYTEVGTVDVCPANAEPMLEIPIIKMKMRMPTKKSKQLKKPEMNVKRKSLPKRLTNSSQLWVKRLSMLGKVEVV